MSNTKTKQPRQGTDANSFLSKRDKIPVIFEEIYISPEMCPGITEVHGLEDLSTHENSNNLHGYID